METLSPLLHFGMNHGSVSLGDIALSSVLLLAGIASLAVVGLAVVAFAQRRSRSYLLITMALTTLLARTVVGALATNGMMAQATHHLTEHMLDGVMAVLLLAAVYYARTTERTAVGDRA
jgi:PhoPQ-activated pathogenicity-related protein